MRDSPTIDELLEAVGTFLVEKAVPNLEGQAAFHARVAANAVALVRRELALRPEAEIDEADLLAALLGVGQSQGDLNAQLCEALRQGRITLATPSLLETLTTITQKQVEIDQPKYSGLAALKELTVDRQKQDG